MNAKYWILVLTGGVEISIEGPFSSENERDKEAASIWKEMDSANLDNVFRMSTSGGSPHVSPYLEGELDKFE